MQEKRTDPSAPHADPSAPHGWNPIRYPRAESMIHLEELPTAARDVGAGAAPRTLRMCSSSEVEHKNLRAHVVDVVSGINALSCVAAKARKIDSAGGGPLGDFFIDCFIATKGREWLHATPLPAWALPPYRGGNSIPRALCVAHYPYLLLIVCHLRQTYQQHALPRTKLVHQPATCRSNLSNQQMW